MKKVLALMGIAVVMVFAGCASTGAAADTSASAAPAASTAPVAGNTFVICNFESKTTDGFEGKGKWADALKVNDDAKFVKEGKYSLKINAKGSTGWNQDIAVSAGPFPDKFNRLKAITMDVFVPKESIKGTEYFQIFFVVNGSANAWYQVPQGLKEGWNSLEYKIDTDNVSGDIWHVYMVFNSGGTLAGPVYIDNIAGQY